MPKNKSYKVLIVEDEAEIYEPLRDCINSAEDFEVLAVTDSSIKAYQLVKTGLPDVVIVDLQLREGDGLPLLKKIRDPKYPLAIRPYLLVLTKFDTTPIIDKLRAGYADYALQKFNKLYDPNLILEHLDFMKDQFFRNLDPEPPQVDSELEIEQLIRARIDSELDQYYIAQGNQARVYLAEIIYKAVIVPTHEKFHITHVYAQLAKQYETKPHNINMAIFRMLQTAFAKTASQDLERIYTPYIDIGRCAPKTNEFVSYTARKIRNERIKLDK